MLAFLNFTKYSLFRLNKELRIWSPNSLLLVSHIFFFLGACSNVCYSFQLPSSQSLIFYFRNFLPHNLDLNLPTTEEFESNRYLLYQVALEVAATCVSQTPSPQGQQTSVLTMGGSSNGSHIWSSESRGVAVPVGVSPPCVSKMLPCLCVHNLCPQSIVLL